VVVGGSYPSEWNEVGCLSNDAAFYRRFCFDSRIFTTDGEMDSVLAETSVA